METTIVYCILNPFSWSLQVPHTAQIGSKHLCDPRPDHPSALARPPALWAGWIMGGLGFRVVPVLIGN